MINKIGLKRNIIDKFYTKKKVAKKCIEYLKKYININKNDLIIEPSAGNGVFIEFIKNLSKNTLFLDIKPENKMIQKQDFFDINTDILKKKYKKIHIIGNPPFGRQSSLALKFIKKSSEFADTISFILPKSFKKDSIKKKIPLNFHLIFEQNLPKNSFLVQNKEYDVPCVFQIWQKKSTNRKIPKKILPNGYIFVKKNEDPDISFRRIGVNAGKISIDILNKSIESHYFIKFINNKPLKLNITLLQNIKFKFNNTVGPKSISKPELIKEFNKLLKFQKI